MQWAYAVFMGVVLSTSGLRSHLDPKPGSPLAFGVGFAVLTVAIGLWVALGRLLERFEYVRLLHYRKSAGTVTIRFSTERLTRQASQVLVLPRERYNGA